MHGLSLPKAEFKRSALDVGKIRFSWLRSRELPNGKCWQANKWGITEAKHKHNQVVITTFCNKGMVARW